MFIPLKFMLDYARDNHFCISRFVVTNLEGIEAVTNAAVTTDSPVLYDIYPPLMKHSSLSSIEYLIQKFGQETNVPVGLFIDRLDSVDECIQSVDRGYTGIMIDLSSRSLEENINGTRKVVDYAHSKGAFVEGQVGIIPLGSEKDKLTETDPIQAEQYVKETGVDAIAVSVGTRCGFYEKQPRLNYELIRKLRNLNVHLTLHGPSGLSREMTRECIRCGISFTGYNKDLFYKYFNKIDEIRMQKGQRFVDPSKIIIPARDEMQKEIEKKIDFIESGNTGRKIISLYKNNDSKRAKAK